MHQRDKQFFLTSGKVVLDVHVNILTYSLFISCANHSPALPVVKQQYSDANDLQWV